MATAGDVRRFPLMNATGIDRHEAPSSRPPPPTGGGPAAVDIDPRYRPGPSPGRSRIPVIPFATRATTTTSSPGCPEDFDDAGIVGFTDLLLVLAPWGECG